MLKISVVICVYNGEAFIAKAFQSISKQNYPNLEIVVCDGYSTDRSIAIVKSFDLPIRFSAPSNIGISHAMNTGAKSATGDIICFLHADDMFYEGCLNKVSELFSKNPQLQWLYGKAALIDSLDTIIDIIPAYMFNYNKLLSRNYIYHQATFMQRSFFNSLGGFDETLKVRMDHDMWLRIGKKYPPLVVNDVFCKHRIHSNSTSFRQVRKSVQEGLLLRLRYDPHPFRARLNHFFFSAPRVFLTTYAARVKARIWKYLPLFLRWKGLHFQKNRFDQSKRL